MAGLPISPNMLQQRRRQRRSMRTDHVDSFSSSCAHTNTKTKGTWAGRRGTQARQKLRQEQGGADKRSLIAPGRCKRYLQSRPRLRHTACSSPKRLPPPPVLICSPHNIFSTRSLSGRVFKKDATTLNNSAVGAPERRPGIDGSALWSADRGSALSGSALVCTGGIIQSCEDSIACTDSQTR